MNASWTLDGAGGSGTLSPGVTFIGYTEDGPATHTLIANWGFGSASSSSSAICAPRRETPPPPTTTVTTSNQPAAQEQVIPVTGLDLGGQSFLRRLLFSLGVLMLGLSMVVKGTANRKRK